MSSRSLSCRIGKGIAIIWFLRPSRVGVRGKKELRGTDYGSGDTTQIIQLTSYVHFHRSRRLDALGNERFNHIVALDGLFSEYDPKQPILRDWQKRLETMPTLR